MSYRERQGGPTGQAPFDAPATRPGEPEKKEESGAVHGVISMRPTSKELIEFIQRFSATLLAAGGQTSRVDRTAARIARAYGFEVELAIFSRHLMLSVIKTAEDGIAAERRTAVSSIISGAPNFQRAAALNALSWSIGDNQLSLSAARQQFESICAVPPISPSLLRMLVSCANASFCSLFNGDWPAMGLVFCATYVGFFLRQKFICWGMDIKIAFFLCSFFSSLIGSLGIIAHLGETPQTAMAASVLFLIPGVPLINAMLDILDGHVLMGVSRLIQASTLIVCIALGLAMTMLLMGVDAL